MVDRKEIKRSVTLRVLGNPLTVALSVIGTTAILSPPLFQLQWPVPLFIGVTSFVAAAASVVLTGLFRGKEMTQDVYDKFNEETLQRARNDLNRLGESLTQDGDSRTEGYLSDLRTLVDSIHTHTKWQASINDVAVGEIKNGIDQLFEGCLSSLRQSLELYKTADKVAMPQAKEALLSERENLLENVAISVVRLGKLASELRVLGTQTDGTAPNLDKIRDGIDYALSAAIATAEQADIWETATPDVQRHRPKQKT